MSDTGEIRRASCHCGAVVIKAYLPLGLASAIRCDCSMCRKRGSAMVTAQADRVTVLQGADNITLYMWGTGTAKHYFCKVCGIYTHHQRRADTSECGINLGCIEGVQPQDHEPIEMTNGVDHPSDRER